MELGSFYWENIMTLLQDAQVHLILLDYFIGFWQRSMIILVFLRTFLVILQALHLRHCVFANSEISRR